MNLIQTLRRGLRFYFITGILWLSTLAGFSQAPVFTNAAIVGGNFQVQVLISSNATFTIETSSDLINWTPVGTQTATSNVVDLVDPRGIAGFNRQFYRLVLGSSDILSFNIGFLEFADAGSFGGSDTPNTTFPVTVNSYSTDINVSGDTDYPAATNIFFTGPAGSGLTNTPANPDNSNTNGNQANYQSGFVTNPLFAPGGTWTINYKGSNYTFNVTTPPQVSHVVVPYPTATVSSGLLQSVSWTYRDATTGAMLGSVPAYIAQIQLQVHGTNAASELYDSPQLAANVTSNVVTNSVTWTGVSGLSMAYQDTDGNNYIISYGGPAIGP